MTTYNELYRQSKEILSGAGIESPAFDAVCLLDHCFGIDRHGLIMRGSETADSKQAALYLSLSKKRAEGKPLQYLVGKWCFMGYQFFVGQGVLIPREDTEVTVLESIKRLDGVNSPKILDLCAGSGTIAVTMAKELPESTVTALELSDKAFSYLKKNITHNDAANATPVKGDIFKDYEKYAEGSFDAIISNPPYIITDEIETLQSEVQHEPVLALDGGTDGLVFYRAIIKNWTRVVKHGGLIAFEIGEGQSPDLSELLMQNGYIDIRLAKDIQGTDRCVSAVRL